MYFRRQDGRVDLLAVHRARPDRYPFLLQSAAPHPSAGRYDILFAFPGVTVDGSNGDFFARLNTEVKPDVASQNRGEHSPVPFCGGWFLLLGYEAARFVEQTIQFPLSPHRLPDALAVRCHAAIVVDHVESATYFVADQSEAQLAMLEADCRHLVATFSVPPPPLLAVEEEPAERFERGVEQILEYLRAGDVFQVNLSRYWQARFADAIDPVSLYERLRRANPAPFSGLVQWRGATILSSSPERLMVIDDGIVETRPIAGTHARARDPEVDAEQRQRLIGSLKERAEHVMLIDLERNDLGRICEAGSVDVSELMVLESYAHVHHIVSNVRGRLRPGVGIGDALRAVFPGGTITGAPKVRAMEIIAELEGIGRGPYTGAMGYLSNCGRLDTNILIRTLVCEGEKVSFRAGAGIVADSVPAKELAETRAKARGLLMALGVEP